MQQSPGFHCAPSAPRWSAARRRGLGSATGLLALLALSLNIACTSVRPAEPVAEVPVSSLAMGEQELELRALLLLLSDRRTYEAFTIHQAMEGDAAMRRQLALALGRIGMGRGGPILDALMADAEVEVRRAAVFAMGLLDDEEYTEGTRSLLKAAGDEDRVVGRLAVEALAKRGGDLVAVTEALLALPANELLPRLLPSLFRYKDAPSLVRWAEAGLEAEDEQLRVMAAYALAREPRPEGVPRLRALLDDPDPWVRGWAARALGRVGDGSDVQRLLPMLDDERNGPRIQALRSLRSLLSAGAAAPHTVGESQQGDTQSSGTAAVSRLLTLMEAADPGVRVTAIESSMAWLPEQSLERALEDLLGDPLPRVRALALLSLAEGESGRAYGAVARHAEDRDPVLRVAAARAAGYLGADAVLAKLALDPVAGVRVAALQTMLAAVEDGTELVRDALQDGDPAVRATALGWLVEHPELSFETVYAAMASEWKDRIPDARTTGVRALGALADADPAERRRVTTTFYTLARDPEYLVRRAAVAELLRMGETAPAVGATRTTLGTRTYREIVLRTQEPRWVEMHTERGTVRLRLDCPAAPLTCLNFLQLAAQGFYEGLTFHRVVPDFVVQAGDPRSDGWGGPGYAIRDEPNLLRYEKGTVGMALSGPDTGGSQFFVTLSPQPHLDGAYTIFGQVTDGFGVLEQIVQGDRILRIVEAPAP